MTSSLKGNDVGTIFIDNCRILRTREPYLLSHCLWLDDKGIELFKQTRSHKTTKSSPGIKKIKKKGVKVFIK
jgi:hypothetical protein